MVKNTIILERRFVPEGTLIMREGDKGNSAYLIQSGSVEVFTEHNEKKVVLAKLELGQIFGEMALVFDENRTASVKALEDTNLIILTREIMRHKLEHADPTIKAIVEMLTKRVVSANNLTIKKQSNLDDLLEGTQLVYDNVLRTLTPSQQTTFQNSVLPMYEKFTGAIRAFKERIED